MTSLRAGTRRELLRASLAGLAVVEGLMVVGCGQMSDRRRALPAHVNRRDIDLLDDVLAAEQRAIAFYTAATPLLSGTARRAAARFLNQDLKHAGIVRSLVRDAGGRPGPSQQPYPFARSTARADLLAGLEALERAQIDAYVRAIPLIASPARRQTLASLMANDAQHLAVIRAEWGHEPLTGAFVVDERAGVRAA